MDPKLQELWSLLCLKPMDLTDQQLAQVIEAEDKLGEIARCLEYGFPRDWQRVVRYRARKAELDKLTTEQLREMSDGYRASYAAMIESDPNDELLPDSAFEPPPIDSDEHIVYELLCEREKTL